MDEPAQGCSAGAHSEKILSLNPQAGDLSDGNLDVLLMPRGILASSQSKHTHVLD